MDVAIFWMLHNWCKIFKKIQNKSSENKIYKNCIGRFSPQFIHNISQ